ncbi:pro-neuregulin-3, membrane-bound isoform-like isoform X1 [Arapaima gigas]
MIVPNCCLLCLTESPTSPPLRSEHFKPCRDKDLAYCLNEGECFVIETLTGMHKHCRCKEGYQGVRCDQFLPKTDPILSDPSKCIHFFLDKNMLLFQKHSTCW